MADCICSSLLLSKSYEKTSGELTSVWSGRNDFDLGQNDFELGRNDFELGRNDLGQNGPGAKQP